MRPYLHKDCKSEVSTYDLTAVICHHGTVGSGHYTSFAKHEITGKWFEYDDQSVTEVSADVVQNCEAYVLFYRKTNPQMTIIRHQAMALDDDTELASDIRFFVSRQWLNKFKTFAEPGPIDNWALLCPHGGLSPSKMHIAGQLVVPLPQPLWEFLYQKFGGGPACNHLFECDICRQAAAAITKRQLYELNEFSAHKDANTSTIYAISMAWFRQWQSFVSGMTDTDPGPINNKSIIKELSDSVLGRGVKPGSDYAQINSTLWKFFHGIYGGGPEIVLFRCPDEPVRSTHPAQTMVTATVHAPITKDTDERMDMEDEPIAPTPSQSQPSSIMNTATTVTEAEAKAAAAPSISPRPVVKSPIPHTSIPTPAISSTATISTSTTTTTTTTATTKITKNVSFDDDNNSTSDREYSSGPPSSHTSSDILLTNLKRGKHHYTAVPAQGVENISRKDKRHRSGIASNSLFGLEGKF